MESNRQLCAAYRDLMTKGFFVTPSMGTDDAISTEAALAATKAWRNEMWKAFRELEDRLCPVQKMEREKRANGTV